MKQQVVNIGLYEEELQRLDAWAAEKGIPRGRAVVAMMNIVTGQTESREQRLARERGLLARPLCPALKEPSFGEGEVRLRTQPLLPGERVVEKVEE